MGLRTRNQVGEGQPAGPVPVISGQPAWWDGSIGDDDPMIGKLSKWICPHCEQRLTAARLICANACHLTVAEYKRFGRIMEEMRFEFWEGRKRR